MAKRSVLGKHVYIKGNEGHKHYGFYGWVVSESIDDDEYLIAGGAFEKDGSGPLFIRNDFTVDRKQPTLPEDIQTLMNRFNN